MKIQARKQSLLIPAQTKANVGTAKLERKGKTPDIHFKKKELTAFSRRQKGKL